MTVSICLGLKLQFLIPINFIIFQSYAFNILQKIRDWTPGSQEKDKGQNASEQSSEYADVVDVMKPKPGEKGKKKK